MKIITSLVRNPTCDVEFQPDSDQDSSENPQIDVIKKNKCQSYSALRWWQNGLTLVRCFNKEKINWKTTLKIEIYEFIIKIKVW